MKKILLVALLVIFIAMPVYARSSGALRTSNIYQISVEVTDSGQTISIPSNSIDVTIRNDDSANDIEIDLQGGSTSSSGILGTEGTFILPYGKEITITDFSSSTITMFPYDWVASPVTVIVTY